MTAARQRFEGVIKRKFEFSAGCFELYRGGSDVQIWLAGRAGRDDVGAIVAMLADDPLGSGRERIEDPLPPSYFPAFEARRSRIRISSSWSRRRAGAVVGCLQLCILPGLSSQGASRALIEDVRVATPRRSRGIGEHWCNGPRGGARTGCRLVELLIHNTRVDAQRFYKRLGFVGAMSA